MRKKWISSLVLMCFLMTTLFSTELAYGDDYQTASDVNLVQEASDTGTDKIMETKEDSGVKMETELVSTEVSNTVEGKGAESMEPHESLLQTRELTIADEEGMTFEDGGPYLYLQYDTSNFNLILSKDGETLYDSTDGVSQEEEDLIAGYVTGVDLGWYDYVLSLKEEPACQKEGSFQLKGQEWVEYWDYQLDPDESWGTSTACVLLSTVIIRNDRTQPAYLALKDTKTDEILTPDYQIMEPEDKGVKECIYFGDLYNEGDLFEDGEYKYPPAKAVTWIATPIDLDYLEKKGDFQWGSAPCLYGPDEFKKAVYDQSASFQVPKGAKLRMFQSGEAHYKAYRVFEPNEIDTSNDSYDVYKFNTLTTGKLNYLVGGWVNGVDTGFLKKVGEISLTGGNPTFTIKDEDMELRDNSKRIDSSYMEDNIYQNTDDSKFVQLKNGGSFDFEAFRVWQSVGSITGNNFVEPDYHYAVLGDSVTLSAIGSLGREKMHITGVQPGVSVIKVTYDALGNFDGGDSGKYANAIDPINTGLIVVNVDGNNAANIKTNIKQTEYDTIYYTSSINGEKQEKQYAEYTFKPTADETISVRVHDPLHNTDWGDEKAWTSYSANADGSYTVHLKEGRNIVEVRAGESVKYYVVNAKGVQVNIENKTNPGQLLKVGDTVKINFKGLSQPIQKMAGIYNPGFPGTCWVQYETEKGRMVKSEGVQYDVIINNDIEFVLTQSGTLNLINGQIHSGHLGSELGKHRNIPADGMLPNLNASSGSNSPLFSTLPNISLNVNDDSVEQELSKMTYAQLYSLESAIQSVKKSWNLVASSWDALNTKRNMVNKWTGGDGPLTVLPVTVNNDMKISARYFLQGESGDTFTEIPDLISGSEKQLINLLKRGKIACIEITVTPKDESKGYVQTYTLQAANNVSTDYPYLNNIALTAVDGSSNMEALDGLLQAETDGGLDLGYGFLTTRKNYTAHVPYSVDKITLTATQGTADNVTINGVAVANQQPSGEIELQTGKNDILVVCSYGGKQVSYTVSVIRDTEPKKIVFKAESGSQVVLMAESGRTIDAQDDGSYMLSEGTYTYIYSKAGYLTKQGKAEIKPDTTEFSLPALEKPMQTYGEVSVRAVAQNGILRDKTTISFTADTVLEKEQDLELQGYVSYNYGGYTALHALINTFNAGISKVAFNCYKGILVPVGTVNKTGLEEGSGWVCEVNGQVCDPATTLVNNGDQIDFYYNNNYAGMQYAWFKENILSITQGNSAEVTLLSTPVRNNKTPGIGVVGAEIMVNGTSVGITDASGKLVIPTEAIGDPGQYTITAQKIENGKNILTYTYALLMVKKKEDVPAVEDGKMTVKFRLIGDAKHKNGTDGHGKYVTWIATKKMTFTGKSVTVRDVFMEALDNAGLDYSITSKDNYVNKIKAPKAYGGYWLEEKDNGPNSGWMYTINGVHPNLGLKECPVNNGDSIIWHYVDDYIEETYFEGNTPKYPNRWLEAEDVDPKSDGSVIDMSNGNGGSTVEEKERTSTATVSAEAKVDSNGKATAIMDKKAISEAIKKVLGAAKSAEKDSGESIAKKVVLEARGKTDEVINSLAMTIPKESFVELFKQVDIISVRTDIGEVRLDKESIKGMADGLDGDVIITITKKDIGALTGSLEISDAQMKSRPAFEFSTTVGSKTVTEFAGDILFSIPYEKASNEQVEALVMCETRANGSLVPLLSSRYADGQIIAQSNHTGTFVIGYNEVKFTDTASHWAKNNILYLAARDIIKGKGTNVFLPNSQITRAEFVQILANMSGDDLSKYNTSQFTDVSEKTWYTKAIDWAVENGIAGGTGSDTFSPNANITRQDMSVMISKYAANISKETLQSTNKEVKFADDYDIASYAKDSVTAMQKAGIINGVKNNLGSYSFNPKSNATRAEAATMIANYLKQ